MAVLPAVTLGMSPRASRDRQVAAAAGPRPGAALALTEAFPGYRLARARESFRNRFWVLPALLLVIGVALAELTVQAGHLGLPRSWHGGFAVDPGETSGILGIVASSTLTFLGVVFTLTLVALQLASSQLSPRVLRTFVRSTVTKLAFGTLLATFSYCVSFLVLEGGHRGEGDSRGVTVALAMVGLCLVIFVGYVALTMKLFQVDWVITHVADETRRALAHCCPPAQAYRTVPEPALGPPTMTVRLPTPRPGRSGGSLGVVQGIDHRRLTRLASRHDCVLELLARVGEFVPTAGTIAAVHGPPVPPGKVLAGIQLGRARTLYQDPGYGLRQLVDIAIQALSPAVNQPTTTTQVIDRLEDLMMRFARYPDRSGLVADAAGHLRLIEPVLGWEELLDLAFAEITRYGITSVQVVRRLLAAYEAIIAATTGRRRAAVEARRTALLAEAAGNGLGGAQLRADPLGLG